jgi:hypothetical protein
MANFFVSYMYRDSYVNGKNFDSPVNYYLTSNTIKSSSYSYRREIVIYKHLDYHTDAGLLLSGDDLIQEIQVNSITPDSTPDVNTQIFTNILFGLSDIKDVYERRFIKFQDIAANVGGTIKFFTIFFELMISYYAYIPFLEALYNANDKIDLIKPQSSNDDSG